VEFLAYATPTVASEVRPARASGDDLPQGIVLYVGGLMASKIEADGAIAQDLVFTPHTFSITGANRSGATSSRRRASDASLTEHDMPRRAAIFLGLTCALWAALGIS
jgi:hypothetical protein